MSSNHVKVDSLGNPKDSSYPSQIEDITAAKTLTADDHGKTFMLNAAAGVQVDLPAVADIVSGWSIKAVVKAAFATTDFTIVSATNVIEGHANVNNTLVQAVNENTISFVASAENIGDYVDIVFNGTSFIVSGVGFASGAITFTAP